MCGIVGYIGTRDKKEILLNGLRELEYRGYDSAGIAVLQNASQNRLQNEKLKSEENKQGEILHFNIHCFRAVGKLKNLESKMADSTFRGLGLAIGHTRWATHGSPNEENAHPHTGEHSALVHNGIIENYKELKAELELQNVAFNSQTDTEVILHLFEFYARSLPVLDAFKKAISRLRGSYAILLITKLEPHKIFYAKEHTPLIIGVDSGVRKDCEKAIDCENLARNTESKSPDSKKASQLFFASSDVALVGLVDRVVYLDDGACGAIDFSDFENLSGIKPFCVNKISAQKEGYRFFMEKEIYEQESVLLETMLGRVSQDYIALDELETPHNIESRTLENLDKTKPQTPHKSESSPAESSFFSRFKNIAICACGTSYHSALVGKYLIERKAGVRVSTHIASEFRYAKPVLDKDELFIAISQSGETADTLQALKLAKQKGLLTLVICNVDNSSMVRESEYAILTRAGIEKGVASTKAFATQVMILWIFSVLLGIKRGKIDEIGIKSEINAMISAQRATKVQPSIHNRIKRLSRRYLHGHGFFFIGRDIFYPLALEGALKLKEISYLHAEGYPSGEMKHGPIALADSELFTLALMPKNLLYEKNKSNVEELIARDSTICAISPLEFDLADDIVKIPEFNSYMEEFFSMMVILQLLALEIAVRLDRDVDMPRNLAKSVTVE